MVDKKTHSQLLAKVILLPFIYDEFNTKDPLCSYVAAYENVTNQHHSKIKKSRKNFIKDFQKSKKVLVEMFAKDLRWNHLDDVQMLLEIFYSGLKLSEYYDSEQKDVGRFYIKHIFDIARTFVTFRDGIVSIRNWSKDTDPFLQSYTEFDRIELWNHISRTAVSDLFIAASYVNFNAGNTECLHNVPNLVYLADMPLKGILKRGVAETHMHANAGISYQDLWRNCTSLLGYRGKSAAEWFCTLFKLCSAVYLVDNTELSFEKYVYNQKENRLHFKMLCDLLDYPIEEVQLKETELLELRKDVKRYFHTDGVSLQDTLFDTVYSQYSGRGTSSEIIWYCKILDYLKHHYDMLLCKCLLSYIRYKNSYFQDKIQQTKISGLDFFQSHYNRATELPKLNGISANEQSQQRYNSIFEEQCKTGNLAVLEMKIAPKLNSKSQTNVMPIEMMKHHTLCQIQKIVDAYVSYIRNRLANNSSDDELRFPKIGFIYHFIKINHSDNFSGHNCGVYNNPEKMDSFDYSAMREVDMRFLDALSLLMQECPLLTDYIVGIDAASIENATEPWVFAPVFRHARSHHHVIPYSAQKGGNIQNIGFTYHVGEDFRHIISGLRHIDEVLTHFDYRSGDRLGHAIALGIDIDHLVARNSMIAIPVMEHLENLLWMWKNAKSSNFGSVPENLEFRIMETARSIYHDSLVGIDVYTLWRVYQQKFKILDDDVRSSVMADGVCTLINKLQTEKWNFKQLVCSHFCPCFHEIYNKPILVSLKTEEVPFYKELQKNLLNKVEQMGVYVETNPSSNLTIGDISSIFRHPILRLNNKGLHLQGVEETCAMVSINSDDPVVFSTFVENEIAYIYYALLNAGCKREEALNWIDKIRMQGIESTFIKYDKSCHEMLKDFEEILKY